ncbi:MAG: aspartate aminotransferase family protein [Chloroflexi bacterium]|nr:aspartate aminotransferase family protein [Chloroflexota bacterium]
MPRRGPAQRSIDEEYAASFHRSRRLYQRALKVVPRGVTHDARFLRPFPIYIERAQGSRKWAVDGHELIDYWMGHGALLLGHSPPEVVEALVEQARKGTHYGACHELEVEWAELVAKTVPCAEKVEFTISGTEATLMAIRMARAFTGRTKLLKYEGHFHGWNDYGTVAHRPPFDMPDSPGVPEDTLGTVVVAPHGDIDATRRLLASRDVACVILEPTGASWGTVPHPPGFLQALREATQATGTVLLFDEVVTGFRWAPGGAQEYHGVTPDLCTLAKCVAGGVPGAAVVGRADIMDTLEFSGDPGRDRASRIYHPGTFNANPLSAAAAVAALRVLRTGRPQRIANRRAEQLRQGLNDVLRRLEVPGSAYGEVSAFHVLIDKDYPGSPGDGKVDWTFDTVKLLDGLGSLTPRFRRAMLLEGVDMSRAAGFTSSAHTEEDVEQTIAAFEKALQRLGSDLWK